MLITNVFVSKTLYSIYLSQIEEKMLENAWLVANRAKTYLDVRRFKIYEGDIHSLVFNQSLIIGARIMIVDTDGIVISDSERKMEGEEVNYEEIDVALNRNGISKVHNEIKDIGPVLYVSAPIISENEIMGASFISYSLKEIQNKVNEITKVLNVIFAGGIVACFFMGFVFATVFSKPIKTFTKTIKRMARGDLNQKVEIKTHDEFRQLAIAFNIMSTKLAETEEERKEFVANVSHELKTPLSIIKLFTSSLQNSEETNIEAYKDFINDIDGEIDRLNHIVEELLLLVNSDNKTLKLKFEDTPLNEMLYKLQQRLVFIAHEKQILVVFDTEKEFKVKVDREKFYQILLNIGNNAVKYTPNGGKITLDIGENDLFVIISIEDTGIGIADKDISKIFDRFYRTDKARGRKTGGAGLGLSIAQRIVRLHQGKIEVESEIGKGTVFKVYIPKDLQMI